MTPTLANLRRAVEKADGTLMEEPGTKTARSILLVARRGFRWTHENKEKLAFGWMKGRSEFALALNAAVFHSALQQIGQGIVPAPNYYPEQSPQECRAQGYAASVDMKKYVRTWTQNGITLSAAIAPCCWMYGSRLQIIIKIGEWTGDFTGTEHIYAEDKRFPDATPDLIEDLTEHVAILPCKNAGCTRTAFDPVAFKHVERNGGRMGECEECWHAKWLVRVDASAAREKAKTAAQDAKMKEKGYKWKTVAWIHPKAGGDDYQMVWYAASETSPNDKTIKGMIARRSNVTNDFKTTAL